MLNIMRNLAAGLLVMGLVCACGSGQDSAGSPGGARVKKQLSAAEQLSRSMVGGVTQTKPGNSPLPIQVKFALQGKPDVAQPIEIIMAIVPTASNLDRIFGKVEGEPGLEMVGSGELEAVDRPVENTPVERTIKVLPQKDGIYTLTATVSVDMGGQISTQTYVFPVIAGKGMPDLPAAPASTPAVAAKTAATPVSH